MEQLYGDLQTTVNGTIIGITNRFINDVCNSAETKVRGQSIKIMRREILFLKEDGYDDCNDVDNCGEKSTVWSRLFACL